MKSIFKNLVEYKGINNCISHDLQNFKQCNYDGTFYIPCQKPDILEITVVESSISILHDEVVKTIKGTSLEGQISTGFKLLISGDINYRIQYSTANSVQVIHITTPFGGYVTLPKDFNINSSVKSGALIEDISIKKLSNRSFYSNITVLLVAYTDC